MAVKVNLDIARPRLTRTVLTSRADGRSWDSLYGRSFSAGALADTKNTFVDPVTKTLMLLPYQLSPAWAVRGDSSAAGVYTRLSRANYETSASVPLSAAQWIENPRLFPSSAVSGTSTHGTGDIYLENRGVNTAVFTAASFDANRGFYLSAHLPAGAANKSSALAFGWGDPAAAGAVAVRVYNDGTAEVYKRIGSTPDTPVGVYSISGATQEAGAAPGQDKAGQVLSLYIIPARGRELLIFGTGGGGFSHVFEDLDAGELNTITPAGRFWWQVESGKASVQCAPLTYPSTGYAVRKVDSLRVAPKVTDTLGFFVARDLPGPSPLDVTVGITPTLVKPDGTTFTPNGVLRDCRIKAALTSNGLYTPFVYAVDAVFEPTTASTSAAEMADIADSVKSIRLSVGESAGDVRCDLAVRVYNTPDGEGGYEFIGIDTQSNRPFEVRIGDTAATATHLVLTGVTREPELTEVQTDAEGTGLPLSIPGTDLWAQLANARYEEDAAAFDATLLTDTIAQLLRHGGIPDAERDIEASTFKLDFSSEASVGRWNFQPRAGDTVAQWLLRLQEDFAPTWFMGFYPTSAGPKFRFRSESSLGVTPKAEIWLHRNGVAGRASCFSFREKVLPPEATRIAVYGYDPALRRFIVDSWSDTTLEDPTTLPSARPEGWRGEVAPFVVVEPRLTTADGVTRAKDELVERIGDVLTLAEWDCSLLMDEDGVPLWRGDVVRIKRQDGTVRGDYRILSFSGTLQKERDTDAGGLGDLRRFSYVGKKVA